MAVYFCDSSAIVQCYVQEQGSVWMGTLLDVTAEHHLSCQITVAPGYIVDLIR